ncbi:hypothetical protein CBS63078_6418 [Aspergillus niger]|nr:hypothetical protein CBS115989_9425 [Aspergillus niger]KAI2829197.1 hypothetical protein CBS133816_4734 [Aspergillus niger]KAI2837837.1 hypothetical protein CBS11350_8502 [Aspergillus niger]KAI2840650.1 hypothetical protein CBS11232_9031 [Aspergillus niger]KAI2852086.1 hypothetical protein CBS12448_8332 [Aspergillus niger]
MTFEVGRDCLIRRDVPLPRYPQTSEQIGCQRARKRVYQLKLALRNIDLQDLVDPKLPELRATHAKHSVANYLTPIQS